MGCIAGRGKGSETFEPPKPGSMKAAVLPVPVCAAARRSCSSMAGIVCGYDSAKVDFTQKYIVRGLL